MSNRQNIIKISQVPKLQDRRSKERIAWLETKGIAGRNDLKRHPAARDFLLAMEDEDKFLQLLQYYMDHFQPIGPAEEFLVEELLLNHWRIRRYSRAETGIINYRLEFTYWYQRECMMNGADARPNFENLDEHEQQAENARSLGIAFNRDFSCDRALPGLVPLLNCERKAFWKNLEELSKLQALRKGQTPTRGRRTTAPPPQSEVSLSEAEPKPESVAAPRLSRSASAKRPVVHFEEISEDSQPMTGSCSVEDDCTF